MRHLVLAAVLALAAGACTPQQNDNVPTGITEPSAPPDAFYVGTWAHSQAECATAPWTIHPTALQAPGGACEFRKITPVQTGYAIDAECIWGGHPKTLTMRLSYAQSAKALLVSAGPEGDTGLIACQSANSPAP